MPHTVTLTWTASPDVPADAYNVYRGLISEEEATLLNATPISGTTYTDSTPLIGQSFYAVKSVQNGVESVFSNEVTVSLPPNPPTNLVAVVN
jgi:fibronectin type 3 domain-containing protein